MTKPRTTDDAWIFADDPILSPTKAAEYLGRARRTLNRLKLQRSPMPGTGQGWGYRRSTLNRYMHDLETSRSRIPFDGPILHSPNARS